MRSVKNDQHLRILLKSFPVRIRLRHMPIDKNRFALFNHFHEQMAGNWFFAVISHQHCKIILADEFQNFRSIFLAIQFWNIHKSPLFNKSISFQFTASGGVLAAEDGGLSTNYNGIILLTITMKRYLLFTVFVSGMTTLAA